MSGERRGVDEMTMWKIGSEYVEMLRVTRDWWANKGVMEKDK